MKKVIMAFALFVGTSMVTMAADKVVVVPLGGKSSGNATTGDVVSGKTFSNDKYNGLTGTRPPAPVPDISHDDDTIGVPWPNPRFTGNFITGYRDNLTGLYWPTPGSTYGSYFTAYYHCDSLEVGIPPHQSTDWRLPDLRELLSLIDYLRDHPALPDGHPFGTIQNNRYWTATPYVNNSLYDAWTINLTDGSLEVQLLEELAFVWCVRGGVSR